MHKIKVFIAESLAHEDFYERDWEGHVAEEVVRLLRGKASYRIVLNQKLLRRAIQEAAKQEYEVFHLSCHGDADGVQLSGSKDLSWSELAHCFQANGAAPHVLVLSSCVGGDAGIARAFEQFKHRPTVIFGAEAVEEEDLITLPSACISWSILYSVLAERGLAPAAFKEAVNKMNKVTPHQFVYRRWDRTQYRRYPSIKKTKGQA